MGNLRELVLSGVNNGAFLLCVSFLGYVMLIVVPFLRRRQGEPGDGRAFAWNFIVPCLDEEAVVERTVRHLVRDFPRARVWCVDDGSTDGTPAILEALARWSDRVSVVTRRPPHARQGKGEALNAAWAEIRRTLPPGLDPAFVILAVVDADGRLDRRCLDVVSGPTCFGDAAVGAVQVQVRVVDRATRASRSLRARLLVRLQDVEFRGVIAAMQTFRRHLGSVGMGGNGQFTRLSVLERIAAKHGTPWHGALLEDFELGLHVLLSGSRTEYCHDTWVAQDGLPTLRTLVRQRSRWAQGSMQCFRYLPAILRSPRITNAGAVEIAYFLFLPWLQLLGGLVYVVCTVVLAWFALTLPGGPAAWFKAGGWGVLPLFVLFGLGPLAVWGPVYRATASPGTSRLRALALGLAAWPYSYVHHVATWWAFTRVLRSRHDWKKTAREQPDSESLPVLTAAVRPLTPAGPGRRACATPGGVVPDPVPTPTAARPAPPSLPALDDWERAVARYCPPRRRHLSPEEEGRRFVTAGISSVAADRQPQLEDA